MSLDTAFLGFDPLTPEQVEALDAKERAEQDEADARLADVLRAAGVAQHMVTLVIERLRGAGITATLRKGHGELTGTILCPSPNGVKHEALVIAQEWQPVEEPPTRLWRHCLPSKHNDYGITPRCTNPAHAHLEQHMFYPYGLLHREKETDGE